MLQFSNIHSIKGYHWSTSVLLLGIVILLPTASSARSRTPDPTAHIQILLKAGRLDEASVSLKVLIQNNPNNAYLHDLAYECYMAQARYPEALNEAKQCLNLMPDRWYFYLHKAIAARSIGNCQMAKSALDTAIALRGELPVLLYERGQCGGLLGEGKLWQDDLDKAAILYLEQGDSEQAKNCIEQKNKLYQRLLYMHKKN